MPFLLQALQAMFRRLDWRPNIYEGGLYTCILRYVEPQSSQKMHSQSIWLSFVKIKLYLSDYVVILQYLTAFTHHLPTRIRVVYFKESNQTFEQIVFFG